MTDNLNATAKRSKDTELTEYWALISVVAACHAITGTTTDALTWVIIPNGGTGLRGTLLVFVHMQENDVRTWVGVSEPEHT